MARVHIDISVFAPDSAVGVVSGAMEVATVPRVGELMSFVSLKTLRVPSGLPVAALRLEVERVLPAPHGSGNEALVMLSDLNMANREAAMQMVAYLQDGFDLYFDEHEV